MCEIGADLWGSIRSECGAFPTSGVACLTAAVIAPHSNRAKSDLRGGSNFSLTTDNCHLFQSLLQFRNDLVNGFRVRDVSTLAIDNDIGWDSAETEFRDYGGLFVGDDRIGYTVKLAELLDLRKRIDFRVILLFLDRQRNHLDAIALESLPNFFL